MQTEMRSELHVKPDLMFLVTCRAVETSCKLNTGILSPYKVDICFSSRHRVTRTVTGAPVSGLSGTAHAGSVDLNHFQ